MHLFSIRRTTLEISRVEEVSLKTQIKKADVYDSFPAYNQKNSLTHKNWGNDSHIDKS